MPLPKILVKLLKMDHTITGEEVTFIRDSTKPGNALSQFCDILEQTELDQEKSEKPGKPGTSIADKVRALSDKDLEWLADFFTAHEWYVQPANFAPECLSCGQRISEKHRKDCKTAAFMTKLGFEPNNSGEEQ